MKIVQCSSLAEAIPLKEHLKLSKDLSNSHFEVFRNNQVLVVVSGIGKIRAAVCISQILTELRLTSEFGRDVTVLCNFGICGAIESIPLGTALLANRIIDSGTKKAYLPDIVLKHRFLEASLATLDKPLFDAKLLPDQVEAVDMEAAGFFEASSRYLDSHQIQCIKIAFDHFTQREINRRIVSDIVSPHLTELLDYLDSLEQLLLDHTPIVFTKEEARLLTEIAVSLRLTDFQINALRKHLHSFKVVNSPNIDSLRSYLEVSPKDKKERNLILASIYETFPLA